MSQRDFNREMGSYLRERKTAGDGFFSKMRKKMPKVSFSKEEEEKVVPDSVPKEHVEMVLRGERVPQPEPEEEFEPRPAKKKPFWHRWFFVVEEVYEEPADDVDMTVLEKKPQGRVDDDVKEMLRTCVKWVNMLPPEKIQEIKRSDEYVEFKRLLDKYGLIKK